MLIDSIKRFLTRENAGPGAAEEAAPSIDPLHLAACVLLLDVAHADGEFSDAEQAHIERVLAQHFSLSPEAGRELLALAERERRAAVDHFRFTHQLKTAYDTGQKLVLAEIMWGVVLADGQIARSGGKELALELEARGYEWLTGVEATA